MKVKNRTVFALALVFAFALAGCGGGGGSSGGGSSSILAPIQRALQSSETRTHAAAAARATPNQGSVTQSSNVGGGTTTLDAIEAEAEYPDNSELRITISLEGENILDSGRDLVLDREDVEDEPDDADNYRRRILARVDGDEAVLADVYTTRLSAADTTDYLVGGVWLSVPVDADSLDDLTVGAFVDGPDLTPTTYLATPATAAYEGGATGLYLAQDGGESGVGQFSGGVELAATFGPAPTISGRVFDIGVDDDFYGEDFDEYFDDENRPVLTLGTAMISTTADGGFFTGDTSGSFTEGRTDSYTGKWGGQFYGTAAERVGGTFGAATTDNQITFVGAFYAEKQPPSP